MGNGFSNIIDFTLIYNKHKKQLYNYVCKMLGEKYIAEDITQNVFLKLYENLENIRKAQSIVPWLYITARNEVYSVWRKEKVKKEIYLDEDYDYESKGDPAEDFENIEYKSIVLNEINKLSTELKETFILREYSGLSYKEISNILKIDESQVKGRLFRARQKLINKISKYVR